MGKLEFFYETNFAPIASGQFNAPGDTPITLGRQDNYRFPLTKSLEPQDFDSMACELRYCLATLIACEHLACFVNSLALNS